MRKYQQKLILDMLHLCEQKHDCMRGMLGSNADALCENLNACIDYAIQTGEFIEQIYGENSQTVSLLEAYCDLLCSMLERRETTNIKALNKQLFKVMNSVHNELKVDKVEVVFFPYKVSMSDSLESIYLAAKADSQCDAYWVPIPYYDKKEDGTLGNMHYEGDAYPDYMESMDWKSYDTALRHPDIIFIHNPYDNYNHVTSVHPQYYSSKLKSQTDLLVYLDYGIPYWIRNKPVLTPGKEPLASLSNFGLYVTYSQKAAESVRLVLSGCESVRNQFTKQELKEKIMALGSPKFDKVLHTYKDNCPLPDSWKSMIGSRKVLLYNTSLNRLLKDNEAFIAEVKKVIHTVHSHDDIVLWWRPHPLMLPTLSSMRPHLLEEYEKLIAGFKQFGKGIYDDTEDLHRAIAWSDGCLTDESSLMFLYLATGKPFSITVINRRLLNPAHNEEDTFARPLQRRIENMKAAKGANVRNKNVCIWWQNYLDEDIYKNVHYDNFLDRFIHYIVHTNEYPQAEEYQKLQLQMFHDFVENSDGTAGQKIYTYCKQRILEESK